MALTLNEKINGLIVAIGLTSSRFADYIDIARPMMSHIVNNRNKPSLEIIQKIISKFPELGLEWTYENNTIPNETIAKIKIRLEQEKYEEELAEVNKKSILSLFDTPISNGTTLTKNPVDVVEKKVAKIVVFYTDNSFEEFIKS